MRISGIDDGWMDESGIAVSYNLREESEEASFI